METIFINIDGGSRGNPGPAASSVVFSSSKGVIKEYSEYLGSVTNNVAEYQALILALKKAKAFFGKDKIKQLSFIVLSDSQLLVKQMLGEYKIQEPSIRDLFLNVWNLKVDFPDISFKHIPREENTRADALVNQTLDANLSKKSLF